MAISYPRRMEKSSITNSGLPYWEGIKDTLENRTKALILKQYKAHYCQLAAQHGVQVMPLARIQTWRVFHTWCVPSAVPSIKAASGTPDAQRWAALTPTCGCRTVRAAGEIAHHHVSLGIIGHHRISLSNRTYPNIIEHNRA